MQKPKISLLTLIAVLFTVCVYGQKGTKSPYSALGLGELNYEGYAVFSSMGGVSMGNMDSTIVNYNNPASYAYIARNKPILQLGMNGKFSEFSTTNNSANLNHFGLNQFQLGLPIAKKWGAVAGIRPFSFKGYQIFDYTIEGEDTTELYVNEGSGGIRVANFGLSYRPIQHANDTARIKLKVAEFNKVDSTTTKKDLYLKGKRYNRVSIGVNANYLFGSSDVIRSQEFLPSLSATLNARVEEGLRVSGLTTEFGINYQVGFNSLSYQRGISIGATYTPATEIKSFQDVYSYTYIRSYYQGENVDVLDTIQFTQDEQGVFLRPEAFKVGFEYRLSPYKSGSLLKIAAELNHERWSTFYTRFQDNQVSGNLKDRSSLGFGLEWTPKTVSFAKDNKTAALARIKYRLGFNYTQTELQVNNSSGVLTQIDNYGMSFGLGIPIKVNNSNTSINFGASLGNLGTTENGLIQERYAGVYFGLSITPGASNIWFYKRKYN